MTHLLVPIYSFSAQAENEQGDWMKPAGHIPWESVSLNLHRCSAWEMESAPRTRGAGTPEEMESDGGCFLNKS